MVFGLVFLGIFDIGATIRTHQETQCLLYAGFVKGAFQKVPKVYQIYKPLS